MGARRTAAGAMVAVRPGHVVTPSRSSLQCHSSTPRFHELSSLSDSDCCHTPAQAVCCNRCALDLTLFSMFTTLVEPAVRCTSRCLPAGESSLTIMVVLSPSAAEVRV